MTLGRTIAACLVLLVAACGGESRPSDIELATNVLDRLLAATPPIGRIPGSNVAIAELLREEFRAAGVDDVTVESFAIPVSAAQNHSLMLSGAAGTEGPHEHEVNVFGGAGTVTAAGLVDVGLAAGVDPAATGKVALLDFSVTRSLRSQYRNVVESGAVAAIIDSKIDTLRQRNVWTLAGAQRTAGPIPIVTVDQQQASAIRQQLEAGVDLRVDLSTDAAVTTQRAYNVIARIPGTTYPERTLVVNGHLDSWYAGAADDGQAVAALVALARSVVREPLPFTVELVALDCEETFLLGSNNYLMRRLPTVRDTLVGAISLEMLAPRTPEFKMVTVDPKDVWMPILERAGLTDSFNIALTPADQMTAFGGEVPSDQGNFWQFGIPGFFVVTTYDEYHTKFDDATNTDPVRFEKVINHLDATLRALGEVDPADLAVRPNSTIDLVPEILERSVDRIAGRIGATYARSGEPVTDARVTVTMFTASYAQIVASTVATYAEGEGYSFVLDAPTADPYVLSFDANIAGKAAGRALVQP